MAPEGDMRLAKDRPPYVRTGWATVFEVKPGWRGPAGLPGP
jgi:hypothetical protein